MADGPYRKGFLEALDGRVAEAKLLRQRLRELMNDLGGEASLSYQESSLAKRSIHLERLAERIELQAADGQQVDLNSYIASVNALSSLYTRLGLRRRPKQLPSLATYLREKEPTA